METKPSSLLKMWKIYSYLGFDNYFIPRTRKLHLQSARMHSIITNHQSKDSPFLRIKELAKSKCYSEDDVTDCQKGAPFEYPSSPQLNSETIDSLPNNESNPQEIHQSFIERADEALQELISKTEDVFDEFELIHEDATSSKEHLKIHLKSYLNKEKHRINIYRSEWTIPCNPETFLEFLNDTPLQISLDPNISEFMSFENQTSNVFLMYLLYKKMFVVESRDFVYLKHFKLIDEQVWGYITKSIAHEKYPECKGRIRGEILLSGNIIKKIKENESKVILYSEINLKINLPVFLMKTKTVSEMKKYVESFQKYLKAKKEEK